MSNLIACHRRWGCGDYRCDSSNASLENVLINVGPMPSEESHLTSLLESM